MKAYLITTNWLLSLMGLSIDTERSPLWAVLLMVAWFAGASLLMRRADKRGELDGMVKRFKLDEE
jgi:hypothetical protein